jgi:alpha-glucosidase
MAYSERTVDIPEHRDMKPAAYWNRRARGLGGRTTS